MAHPIRYRQLAPAVLVALALLAATTPPAAEGGVERSRRAPASGHRRMSQTRPAGGQVEVNRPRTIFDCDTPRGEAWYGSTDHCLRELCAGGNFTNQYVDGADNRPRKNPCYGRDPYELQR